MAINTENKRRSIIPLAPFTIPPVPDGTIGAPDRVQMGYQYSGITIGAPVVITWTSIIIKGLDVISGQVVYIKGYYR